MVPYPLGRSAITDSYSYLHCAVLLKSSYITTSILLSIHAFYLSLHVAFDLRLHLSITVNYFLQYFPVLVFWSDYLTKTTLVTAIKDKTSQTTYVCIENEQDIIQCLLYIIFKYKTRSDIMSHIFLCLHVCFRQNNEATVVC